MGYKILVMTLLLSACAPVQPIKWDDVYYGAPATVPKTDMKGMR